MKGEDVKKRLKELRLTGASVAAAMGVAPSAMTGYFNSIDLRTESVEKIDAAIRLLTNQKYGLIQNAQETQRTIEEVRDEHSAANGQTTAVDAVVAAYTVTINTLERMLAEKDKTIASKEQTISALTQLVANKEITIDALRSENETLRKLAGIENGKKTASAGL